MASRRSRLVLVLVVAAVTSQPCAARSFNRPAFLESLDHNEESFSDHLGGRKRQHASSYDHKFILGSNKETTKYQKMSPEASADHLRSLLDKMDEDADGKIMQKELHDWILKSMKSLASEGSVGRHQKCDTDSSGDVSWSEYVKAAFKLDLKDDFNATLRAKRYSDQAIKAILSKIGKEFALFTMADRDTDSRLSLEEFQAFNNPEGYPDLTELVLTQDMAKDKDKDGKLSFTESYAEDAHMDSVIGASLSKEKFYSDIDRDQDGKVNKHELRLYLHNPYKSDIRNEVLHLFDYTDEDLDGYLSFEEVMDNQDHFIGSSYVNTRTLARDEL